MARTSDDGGDGGEWVRMTMHPNMYQQNVVQQPTQDPSIRNVSDALTHADSARPVVMIFHEDRKRSFLSEILGLRF